MVLDYVETHLVDHCNLGCKGCGHFSPLSEERFTSLTTFKRDFSRLKNLFENISIIRLMGGEPLLHPDVSLFSEFSRVMFPRASIRLVTNGILLLKQPDTFWEQCARDEIEIQVSEYPIKPDLGAMGEKGESAGVKVGTGWVGASFLKWMDLAGDSDPDLVFLLC
jgi:molybdenum cofactor biosynthesis enzyme MoaA